MRFYEKSFYKQILIIYKLLENKKMIESDLMNFYSNDMVVSKDHINLNYLKLTYQRISVKDLEKKHKEWAEHASLI